jgi:hypothetical protein
VEKRYGDEVQKVELTVVEEDGREVVKTLEGAEAEKWRKWMESVCALAWTHGRNPPWGELQ